MRLMNVFIILIFSVFTIPGVLLAEGQQEQQEPKTNQTETQKRAENNIADDIRERLQNNPEIPGDRISVAVENYKATLSGTVSDYSDVALAEKIADRVAGVSEVINSLTVEPNQEALAGDKLAARVRGLIERDALLSKYDIDVNVLGRSVTLTGNVDSLWIKEYAAEEVGDISGITELKNEIAIVPTDKVEDKQIANNLKKAINIQSSTDAENVTVIVKNGNVTLEGTVRSEEAKNNVAELARSASGVQVVINELTVDPAIARPEKIQLYPDDSSIRSEIKFLLEHDIAVDENEIDVTVEKGTVTLSGAVDSFAEKSEAVNNAWSVLGVTEVNDQLIVDTVDIATETTAEEVRKALLDRASIELLDFQLKVDSGTVTITGTAESIWQKKNATDVVQSISGVTEVRNLLAVVPENEIEDEVLAEDVVESLQNNKLINPKDITVRINDSVVTLTGSVDSFDERKSATESVQSVPGVVEVKNELNID
ncbi:MAG: BON domain-containing protein [Spirochaetales bacterium]|nr:BON domain-containing protein [Spirochaetales bacterium]